VFTAIRSKSLYIRDLSQTSKVAAGSVVWLQGKKELLNFKHQKFKTEISRTFVAFFGLLSLFSVCRYVFTVTLSISFTCNVAVG
jgi:hypothetical protein